MHLLVPYVQLRHPDPLFDEFTYGDVKSRARKLKADLKNGDYVFFHTSKLGKKYITAYFVVDRVIDTKVCAQTQAIRMKYKNPHIEEYLSGESNAQDEDAVLFGDPILSQHLKVPLLFDKEFARKLSLNIKFPPGRSENVVIGSATRAWRELTDKDVSVILSSIQLAEGRRRPSHLLSSEEVAETIEKDVEDYLVHHPELLGKGLKVAERQLPIESGRIDLLFEDSSHLVVIEVKLGRVGRDALHQVRSYLHEMRKMEPEKNVSGVLVCSGVMPAYEQDFRKQKDVRVLVYGWEMRVETW